MNYDGSTTVRQLIACWLCAFVGLIIGLAAANNKIHDARAEGARACARQQPGYVRQSVAACIQEVQQKAQRCQELSLEMRQRDLLSLVGPFASASNTRACSEIISGDALEPGHGTSDSVFAFVLQGPGYACRHCQAARLDRSLIIQLHPHRSHFHIFLI